MNQQSEGSIPGILKRSKRLFILLLFHLLFLSTKAQTGQEKKLFEYVQYDGANGLERKRINDILADENGFLWLATEKGIIRFDRKNFVEIELEDKELENSKCAWLRRSGDRLYAVFPGSGFAVINLRDFTDVYSEHCVISDLSPTNQTDYAVLLSNGTLELRSKTRLLSTKTFESRKPGNLTFFKNNLFISIPDRSVFRLDIQSLQIIDSSDFKPKGFRTSFTHAVDKLYFLDDHWLYGWDGKSWISRPSWSGIHESEPVTRIFSDRDGIIFSRYQRNLVIVPKGGVSILFEADSIKNFEFYSICRTGDHIFAGTNQGLLAIKPRSKAPAIINDNIQDNKEHVRVRRKIMELENGDLLLWGFPYSYCHTAGNFKRLCERRFSAIDAVKISDTIYVSTEGSGLLAIHYPTGKTNSIIIKDELEPLGFYFALYYDKSKKLLLVGSYGKLIAVDLPGRKAQHISLKAVNASVRCILRLKESEKYLVGTSQGLFILDDDFHVTGNIGPEKGIKGSMISDLLLDSSSNSIYVAHDYGISILDPKTLNQKTDSSESPFDDLQAVSMIRDKAGRIWAGTYYGLVCYDPKDNSRLHLTRKNNLVNSEYNYRSALALKDGRIIFGGLNCYDIITPDEYNSKSVKNSGIVTGYHLYSENDTVFYGPISSGYTINFNIEKDLLRIYLSSKGGWAESVSDFEYSINGGPWRPTGDEPYLDIFLLEPGKYKLSFRSFDFFGNPIVYPKINVEATVPFYKSGPFIFTIVAIAIFALVLYSISYSRHNKAMVALRDKIAMDLHDEVGSILTYTLYQTKNKESQTVLSSLQHNLREAIYALRVYVKSIDQLSRSYLDLVDGVREFLSSTFPSDSFNVSLNESHDFDLRLKAELYRDIKLCIFELCTNILKHSDAKNIEISITKKDMNIHVCIKDDGTNRSDNGLFGSSGSGSKNILKRVSRYGGSAEYSTGPDSKGLQADIFFNI